jgi:hypothetical protein
MKKCSKCSLLKPLETFNRNSKTKTGYRCECKDCQHRDELIYSRTLDGLIAIFYTSQRKSARKRGMAMPSYTKEELRLWLLKETKIVELYNTWAASNYSNDLKPSIDRLDGYISYTLDNIRLVTWEENRSKSHEDTSSGKNQKRWTPVIQYTLEGKFLAEYPGVKLAVEATGTPQSSLIACCQGARYKSGGYIWRYKEGELIPKQIEVNIPSAGSKNMKRVKRLDMENTEHPICIFNSVNEAAMVTGIGAPSISKCLKGVRGSAGGYIWSYVGWK